MLSVYTRHYPPWETDSNYRRCRCPKWINAKKPLSRWCFLWVVRAPLFHEARNFRSLAVVNSSRNFKDSSRAHFKSCFSNNVLL